MRSPNDGESYIALIDANRLDYYHQLERERIHLLLIDEASKGLDDVTDCAEMNKQLPTQGTRTFVELRQANEHGAEYWSARDLQTMLGYSQWRRFRVSSDN